MGNPNTSPAFDNYILARDFTASIRLNCQHYIWLQELGYNLHPSIPVSSLGENPRIADVATGTGVWLLEIARSHPTATCDGFDISLEQAPPAVWLPNNVTFSAWNMFNPPPAHLVGTYDIVHIRLVTLVIENKDPVSTIRNLAALLKPNGYIQWDEIDLSETTVAHAEGPMGKMDAVRKMDALMKGHGSHEWILKLPESMTDNGFEGAKLWRVKPNMALVKHYTDCHTLSFAEIASKMPDSSDRKREFQRMVQDVGEETKRGAVHGVAKVVCVGRKSI